MEYIDKDRAKIIQQLMDDVEALKAELAKLKEVK